MAEAQVEDVTAQVEDIAVSVPAAAEKVEESSSTEAPAPAPENIWQDEQDNEWKTAFTENEYDAIILGTGMKECLLSGLLSVNGKKVLHLDRNGYYGAASASLDIHQLFKKFRGEDAKPDEKRLGKLRDYLVDLVPKFVIADGQLVKVLLHTGVNNYIDFKNVEGSFVFRRGAVHKVPVTPGDALNTTLMSPMEKTRAVMFFKWVDGYDANKPSTHVAGLMWKKTLDLNKMTAGEFLKYWNLEQDTCDFVAHAIALYQEESYVNNLACDLVSRMQLYKSSLLRFAGLNSSPYMYPLYGLGELPQSFARLAAVYGGTYMLNRDIDEVVYDNAGKAVGVSAQGVQAKAGVVIGDPSYFPGKTRKIGKVVRALAIIDHPLQGTNGCGSCQIIFPQNQVKRKNDLYLFCVNKIHQVSAPGTWIAFASTKVEGSVDGLTAEQVAQRELGAALGFLQPSLEIFYDMYDLEEPTDDGSADNVYVSKSYDETSHFETAITDVLDIYTRITGSPPDLSKVAPGRSGE